jgi:two-component system CheB/CheR fusion protein
LQDITDMRASEDYSRYLGRVMSRALNEIYFLDPETLRFALTNEGAQKKLGYSAGRLEQMIFPDILPGIEADEVRALLAPLLSGAERDIVFETTIEAADGHRYPAEIGVQYFGDDAPPILVAVVHDTTERQLLGALR